MRGVLEKYIFSREFNFDNKLNDAEQPRMLDRFVGGLLHPVIHTGYGYEFGLPGIVAEGNAPGCIYWENYVKPCQVSLRRRFMRPIIGLYFLLSYSTSIPEKRLADLFL